ncbi:macoilin-1-like [Sinocyclocheilus grahami]|nr:PREDICTED: macoilin-1-like [Sinocyclocheilus grahami]
MMEFLVRVTKCSLAQGHITFLYLKFLVVWALVLLADFVLEFRFEYLWPFWLFIRSVYDSFRYQGLAFSVFFVCVAFTSDIICLLFIPVQWLFFAASTYVWVQYVWHTERGVCLPTVSLWILFVYIEAAIRFKDLKHFHVDLCRPFAAHCNTKITASKKQHNHNQNHHSSTSSSILLSVDSKAQEMEYMENHVNSKRLSSSDLLGSTENLLKEEHSSSSSSSSSSNSNKNYKNASGGGGGGSSSPRGHGTANGSVPSSSGPSSSTSSSGKGDRKQKCGGGKNSASNRDPVENCIPNNQLSKPEALVRLEQDVKKLKADLQASRQTEQDLRSQLGSLGSSERSIRSELGQLRQENELLQNKLHNAVQAKQKDKQTVVQLEKRLKAEQEARAATEKQLAEEKKRKKLEEATAARAVALAAATRGECTESLRRRISELETECKKLTLDIKVKEDQVRELELKVQELHKYKENEKDTEVLMSALSAMQDKTLHLENSLSAETRIKLDLFSALGDAKRQLEIAQGLPSHSFRGECTESLRRRISELETECKKLTLDIKVKEDQVRELELKVQELHKYKENEKDTEVLMSALSAMQDKTLHLENSLSAETRIKLDLFSALGDAKRQLEIAQGQILQKDQEIKDLKQKIAEVMAVMPSVVYSADTGSMTPVTPHYSSKFMDTSPSGLDPNASVYQPLKK